MKGPDTQQTRSRPARTRAKPRRPTADVRESRPAPRTTVILVHELLTAAGDRADEEGSRRG